MVISMLSMTSFSQTLVAHYPLDGNADNYAPGFLGQYDGVVPSGTFLNDSGHYALQFDGIDDYMEVSVFSELTSTTTTYDSATYIISMWVKIDNSNGMTFIGNEHFLSMGYNTIPNSKNQITFGTYPDLGNMSGHLNIGTLPKNYIRSDGNSSNRLEKGLWYHIALRHDTTLLNSGTCPYFYSKKNYEFYLNGQLINSNSQNPVPGVCGASPHFYTENPPVFPLYPNIVLGKSRIIENGTSPASNNFFHGIIDDVRIYKGVGSSASDAFLIDSLFNNPPLTTTSLLEHEQFSHSINTYPNPSIDGLFNVQTSLTKGNYSVYDLSGRIVLTGAVENRTQINLSSKAKGIYFLKIEDEKRLSKSMKLVYQ